MNLGSLTLAGIDAERRLSDAGVDDDPRASELADALDDVVCADTPERALVAVKRALRCVQRLPRPLAHVGALVRAALLEGVAEASTVVPCDDDRFDVALAALLPDNDNARVARAREPFLELVPNLIASFLDATRPKDTP